MADEVQAIRGINWRETFPFTHLFRAFRIAMHPSKLVLGLIALLALYVGGRVLDGIWSPRSLAVPGEVSLYESTVTDGGTSDEFIAKRQRAREAIESDYADHLIADKVMTDRDAALEAARTGARFSDLKRKILENRDTAIAEAQREHELALKTAAGEKDSATRDKMILNADEAYRYSVRNISPPMHILPFSAPKPSAARDCSPRFSATKPNASTMSSPASNNGTGSAPPKMSAAPASSIR